CAKSNAFSMTSRGFGSASAFGIGGVAGGISLTVWAQAPMASMTASWLWRTVARNWSCADLVASLIVVISGSLRVVDFAYYTTHSRVMASSQEMAARPTSLTRRR